MLPFFLVGCRGRLFVAKSLVKSCRRVRGWTLLALVILTPATAASDYGTTGLIDTPTARMKSDGTFSTTAAFDGPIGSLPLPIKRLRG